MISNSFVRILWIIQRSYATRHEGEGLGFNSQWRYIKFISASSVTLFFSASLQCVKYDPQFAVEVLAQKKVSHILTLFCCKIHWAEFDSLGLQPIASGLRT